MTGMKWFRFYAEVLHDPKVQRLPAQLFKDWVNVMCCASSHDGEIPRDIEDFAFCMRLTRPRAEKLLLDLKDAGLVDITPGSIKPHNWDSRQYQSDTSTPRVKRFREKKKGAPETSNETFQKRFGNAAETADETVPEQNRTEQSRYRGNYDFEAALERIAERHPKSDGTALGIELIKSELVSAVNPEDLIASIEARHIAYCESKRGETNDRFIKSLANWVKDLHHRDPSPKRIVPLEKPPHDYDAEAREYEAKLAAKQAR